MQPLNWKVTTWSLGLFAEAVLPGFQWLSPWSFVLGLVETFVYGAFAGLIFTLIHNFVAGRVRA